MQATTHDINAILEVIKLYDEGHAGPDFAKLRQAFHPKASVVGHYQGELMFSQREDYIEILKTDPPPDPNSVQPELKLRSLDIVGDTAVATVESTMVETKFTSHLSLIRDGARWQIVNGLFHANPT